MNMRVGRAAIDLAGDLARTKLPPRKGALPKDVFPGRGPPPEFGRKPIPRQAPKRRPGPGDALEIGLSFIPIVGPALMLGELLDDLFAPVPVKNPEPLWYPSEWWELCKSMNCQPPTSAYDDMGTWYRTTFAGYCEIQTCPAPLTGVGNQKFILPSPSTHTRVQFWRYYRHPRWGYNRNVFRYAFERVVDEPYPEFEVQEAPTWTPRYGPRPAPMVNPNYQRATPVQGPTEPAPTPEPPPAPADWQWNSGGPPWPPPRPHLRIPPARGSKEQKTRTRSARIGQAMFNALDRLSESAEVVDAIYDALPDDVKRRWGKDRKSRNFVDTAGQYGVDGADWKLEALYHNWHKVDWQVAFKNIIKNDLEDRIIGGVHKRLPNNVVNAFNRGMPDGRSISPEMAVSGWVDALFGD